MRITVFTPTYNRGYIIERLYRSLQRQSLRDFEWIVVDDGSVDSTEELFAAWCKEENSFPITYKKVPNGGKHRAVNIGLELANGELFFIVDSDDYLPDNALERIDAVEKSIAPEIKQGFCGVCGLKGEEGKAVGTTYKSNGYLDISTLEREKYEITGDKAEVFYSAVLKSYPFPEFDRERFVTECVVWDKMAYDGYKLRFFNELIYFCDYLPDGLTFQGFDLYANSPKGWGLYIHQSIQYGKLTGKSIEESYLNYYYAVKKKKGISIALMAEYLQCSKKKLRLIVLKDCFLWKPLKAVKKIARRIFGNKRIEELKAILHKEK